ncbi:MAG: methyltransferase domain-containing protein, partial [Acidimicrobiales bacterium]
GAASLPLAPPAGRLEAVDESQSMLDAFAAGADRAGIDHTEVRGRWPDVAPEVDAADVVVCHHVVYNVADLVPFLTALDGHARRRVVIELTYRHPQSDLNPLWAAIHGTERPDGPTAVTAAEVVKSLGYDGRMEVFERPARWQDPAAPDHVAFVRRRLCVGPERDADIAAQLARLPTVARRLVTLWWDVRRP